MTEETKLEICSACGHEVEYTCTAFLTEHKKEEGVCKDCKKAIEEKDLQDFADGLITKLCDNVNAGSPHDLGLAMSKAIQAQHRHLQGQFFTALWQCFKDYQNAGHDARNEWAVKIAKTWYECL